MLVIRLKRTGRKGYAQFRFVVQDSHRHPSSGKVVEYLGSFDPHTKTVQIKKDLVEKFMSNGAQPSNRVARLLKQEGIKLPDWVKIDDPSIGKLRNPKKLRKNQPKEVVAEEPTAPEEAPAATEEAAKEA